MASSFSSPSAAPLPPLPDLSGKRAGAASGSPNPMDSIMSGIAPVKQAVDQIIAGVRAIVQSGVLPGVEDKAGQVVAWASGLLPQAIQQLAQPGGGAPPQQGGIPPIGSGQPNPGGPSPMGM